MKKILAIETIATDANNIFIVEPYEYENINNIPVTEIKPFAKEGFELISGQKVCGFIPYHAVAVIHYNILRITNDYISRKFY